MIRLFLVGSVVSAIGFYFNSFPIAMVGGWLMGLPFSVTFNLKHWDW